MLYGKYVFGDYGSGVGAPVPSGHVMTLSGNKIEVLKIAGKPKDLGLFVLGFAQDLQGELAMGLNSPSAGMLNALATSGVILKYRAVAFPEVGRTLVRIPSKGISLLFDKVFECVHVQEPLHELVYILARTKPEHA